jgi:hypothetical protein
LVQPSARQADTAVLGQLDYIVKTYARFHKECRPHQGLGNIVPAARGDRPAEACDVDIGSIRCQHFLGGLLKHYYREAA